MPGSLRLSFESPNSKREIYLGAIQKHIESALDSVGRTLRHVAIEIRIALGGTTRELRDEHGRTLGDVRAGWTGAENR